MEKPSIFDGSANDPFISSGTVKQLDALESVIKKLVSKKYRERNRYMEMMAAEFLKETKIPVRHCVLIEQRTLSGDIHYYYADKRKIKQ